MKALKEEEDRAVPRDDDRDQAWRDFHAAVAAAAKVRDEKLAAIASRPPVLTAAEVRELTAEQAAIVASYPFIRGCIAASPKPPGEAFADSMVPFERILQALYADSRERTRERTAVFQVLLNMVDVGETERLWARLGAERVIGREPIPRYELAVYVVRRSTGVQLGLLYDSARFLPEQGHALLEHLRASLQALLDHPSQRLSALALRRPDAAARHPCHCCSAE